MSKGGGKTQEVKQDNSPWVGAQPYLRDLFGRAQAQSQGTGISPQTQNVQGLIYNRALAGSPLNAAAGNQVQKTLEGGYTNPFASGALGDAMDMAKSKINAQFSGDNYGNSAHQEWLGRGITSAAMPFASQMFENERGRQLGAAQLAPAIAGQDFSDLGQGLSVSRMADDAPWNQLLRYQQAISGAGGGSSVTQQPYSAGNPIGSMLGGALGGHALAGALGFAGPWGALAGAGLGLLGSR